MEFNYLKKIEELILTNISLIIYNFSIEEYRKSIKKYHDFNKISE
jgi:hypothetical protein